MKFVCKTLLFLIVMLAICGVTLATSNFYENDVTPPVGRFSVVDSTLEDGVNYVEMLKFNIQLYAKDDMCADSEIKYYISTSPIYDTEKITFWESYTTDKIVSVKIPSATGINTVSIVFKDLNGNTSKIYTGGNAKQTVVYDSNGGSEISSGVNTERYFGAPFVVTNQIPKKEGCIFLGWSTDASANTASYEPGDIIAADASLGNGASVTLYAVWFSNQDSYMFLSDVAQIGDYVNYPVFYENVDGSTSTHNGWRVLNIELDGRVNLISAGVPLSYYHGTNSTDSITQLTTNFTSAQFNSGFNSMLTLMNEFDNKYTSLDVNGIPRVKALQSKDIMKTTGLSSIPTGTELFTGNYGDLFSIGSTYYVASIYFDDTKLLGVNDSGLVMEYSDAEYGVRPVVSLKPVTVTDRDLNNAWNIEDPSVEPGKNAEFVFGTYNSKETIVGTETYVMPNVSSTVDNEIGSITVEGQTIYYPIVDLLMSDNTTSHSIAYSAEYPVFENVVTITDYANLGLGKAITYDGSTTTLPVNLYPVSDTAGNEGPEQIFKYGSTSAASSNPSVRSSSHSILIYDSPSMTKAMDEYQTVVKWRYIDNAGKTYYYYVGYYAPAQEYSLCITSDTLVTLQNGSQKRIDELTYSDKILAWDFEKGKYTVTTPAVLYNHGEDNHRVINLGFDDGTTVRIIGLHDLFDADANEFVGITEANVASYLGHNFVKSNIIDNTNEYKTVKLVNYSITEEYIGAYSILTAKHLNCFIEGMFSRSPSPNSLYEDFFDFFEIGDNMKYDEEAMKKDIETYGLYTYEDYKDYVTYEQFVGLNGAYFKVLVGKGYITFEDVIQAIYGFVPQK